MDKRLSAWSWRLIIIAIVIVIGFLDWLTGFEMDFLLFYFLPVSLAAWFLGLYESLTVAIVCALVRSSIPEPAYGMPFAGSPVGLSLNSTIYPST